jgi:hypothetical protein
MRPFVGFFVTSLIIGSLVVVCVGFSTVPDDARAHTENKNATRDSASIFFINIYYKYNMNLIYKHINNCQNIFSA